MEKNLVGALLSAARNFKRRQLYDKISCSVFQDSLNDMSCRDFEFLVGEYFRRWQFNVKETKSSADCGADLIAEKDKERYLIQCKHGKADKLGVEIIQDLPGVMVRAEATGGIVVTSGEFKEDAVTFARANSIMLLDGRELHNNIKSQLIFESRPDRKTDRVRQKMKWALAGLLVAAICLSVFHFGEIGTSIYSSLPAQIKRFFPDDQEHRDTKNDQIDKPIKQTEDKNFKFTDDQVKRAMEEVLSKKK